MEQPVLNKMMPMNTEILNESYQQCEYCGYRLEEKDGQYVCTHCGRIYQVSFSTLLGRHLVEVSTGADRKQAGKKVIIGLIITFLVVAVIFTIFSGNFNFFDSKIQKLIKLNNLQNVIDYESVTEVAQVELQPNVKSLSAEYNVVLLSHRNPPEYTLALVNYSKQKMMLFDYGNYFPLRIITDDFIADLPEAKQIDHLSIVAGYINKYGLNCFDDRDIAEMYMKQTTGFYDVNSARSKIEAAALYKIPNRQNTQGFEVSFDGQSAVPLWYATKSSKLVYNWFTPPEEVYPTWKAVTDYQTQKIMISIYGPPYVEKTTWTIYDPDMKMVGICSNLQSVKIKNGKVTVQ